MTPLFSTLQNSSPLQKVEKIKNGYHHRQRETIIGANALVTSNTSIPPKSLVLGSPAKVVRTLKPEELRKIEKNAEAYVKLTNAYLELDLD